MSGIDKPTYELTPVITGSNGGPSSPSSAPDGTLRLPNNTIHRATRHKQESELPLLSSRIGNRAPYYNLSTGKSFPTKRAAMQASASRASTKQSILQKIQQKIQRLFGKRAECKTQSPHDQENAVNATTQGAKKLQENAVNATTQGAKKLQENAVDATTKGAEKLLSQLPEGFYMVRYSQQRESYVVSCRKGEQVQHLPIQGNNPDKILQEQKLTFRVDNDMMKRTDDRGWSGAVDKGTAELILHENEYMVRTEGKQFFISYKKGNQVTHQEITSLAAMQQCIQRQKCTPCPMIELLKDPGWCGIVDKDTAAKQLQNNAYMVRAEGNNFFISYKYENMVHHQQIQYDPKATAITVQGLLTLIKRYQLNPMRRTS